MGGICIKSVCLATLLAFVVFDTSCGSGTEKIIASSFRNIETGENNLSWWRKLQTHQEGDTIYLELKNGRKIFGAQLSYTTGILGGMTKIDSQIFRTHDVKCKVMGDGYWVPVGYEYAKRIIHGTLSVFRLTASQPEIRTNSNTSNKSDPSYYATNNVIYYIQKGNDSKLVQWNSLNQLKGFIDDCPVAADMLHRMAKTSLKELGDTSYLLRTIWAYNNCKK